MSVVTTYSAAVVNSFLKLHYTSTRGKCCPRRGSHRRRAAQVGSRCWLNRTVGPKRQLTSEPRNLAVHTPRNPAECLPNESHPTRRGTTERAEPQLLSPRPTRWAGGANILQGERGRVHSESGHHDDTSMRSEEARQETVEETVEDKKKETHVACITQDSDTPKATSKSKRNRTLVIPVRRAVPSDGALGQRPFDQTWSAGAWDGALALLREYQARPVLV